VPEKVDRRKFVISCLTHFEPENEFKINGWNRAIKNSDFLVAISDFTYEMALRNNVPKNRIMVIRYGVDDKYRNTFKILIVGRPGRRKGENFLNKLKFLLRFEKNIEWRSASESGWGLEVITSSAKDLTLAYAWADVLLVPSSLEGAHTGTLEALRSGLPVITRSVGWAYSEFKSFVTICDSEIEMATQIIRMKNEKVVKFNSTQKKLDMLGFTFDNWRIKHQKLFAKFENL
jgi:glycosyltransferase involved in cell wall biosynthesis